MKSHLLNAASVVVPNQQILVNMVSQRVRQLAFKARPLVVVPPGMATADIALTEIADHKLTYKKCEPDEPVEAAVIPFPKPKIRTQIVAA